MGRDDGDLPQLPGQQAGRGDAQHGRFAAPAVRGQHQRTPGMPQGNALNRGDRRLLVRIEPQAGGRRWRRPQRRVYTGRHHQGCRVGLPQTGQARQETPAHVADAARVGREPGQIRVGEGGPGLNRRRQHHTVTAAAQAAHRGGEGIRMKTLVGIEDQDTILTAQVAGDLGRRRRRYPNRGPVGDPQGVAQVGGAELV